MLRAWLGSSPHSSPLTSGEGAFSPTGSPALTIAAHHCHSVDEGLRQGDTPRDTGSLDRNPLEWQSLSECLQLSLPVPLWQAST